MNSSKTWKSGEKCRSGGTYRCRNCQSAGRNTTCDLQEGAIFPMCEACPQKDVTFALVRSAGGAASS